MLRSARCEAGVDLVAAALAVPVHPEYLRRLEEGEEGPPSNLLLERLTQLYGADPDPVFSAAGRIPPDLYRLAASPEGLALLREYQRRLCRQSPVLSASAGPSGDVW